MTAQTGAPMLLRVFVMIFPSKMSIKAFIFRVLQNSDTVTSATNSYEETESAVEQEFWKGGTYPEKSE